MSNKIAGLMLSKLSLVIVLGWGLAVLAQPASFPQVDAASASKRRQEAHFKYFEAQRLKGEAQRTRSRQLLEESIRALQATIQLDPTAAEPHVDLGELYFFYLSQNLQAEREAQEAIRLDPAGVSGHLLLARLRVFAVKGETNPRAMSLERAVAAYEKVAELDPKNAEAWAFLAELYSLRNQPEKQTYALEKWAGAPVPTDQFFFQSLMSAELSPDRAYYQLSQLYLSQNKNREAINAARRAYEMNPEDNDYSRNLVGILRVAGTSDDEVRILSQLFKSANSSGLLLGYGSALIRAGRYTEAIERMREYARLDPSNLSAYGLLAIAQRRAGQRAPAVETLKTALTKVESEPRTDLMLELAQTYEELGRNDDAIAQYESAFEHYTGKGVLTPANTPLFNEVVHRLAKVFRQLGSQSRLQTLLMRTRRLVDEHNPIVELITIEGLRDDGKNREALELTRAAARRYPDDRSLQFTEALILSDLNRVTESTDLLRNMMKGHADDDPEDAGIYLLLGGVYLQHGKLKEAEDATRKSIALNPEDPEGAIQLSSILEKAGQFESAETGLRELLKQHPDNATAMNNLGYFLLERSNRYAEAQKLIEQAVAIEPTNGSFLDSLGWAQFKLGNAEKAREILEKALTYSRRSATIREHLGDVLQKLGRVAEARRNWEKALELSLEADGIARIKVKLKGGR
ncbi:MAG: tetratricopeptide repeat protein [Acidobacteria bacterium]|nr:tetratricopeptide repeat protein [Acidobacteriota bacterium]